MIYNIWPLKQSVRFNISPNKGMSSRTKKNSENIGEKTKQKKSLKAGIFVFDFLILLHLLLYPFYSFYNLSFHICCKFHCIFSFFDFDFKCMLNGNTLSIILCLIIKKADQFFLWFFWVFFFYVWLRCCLRICRNNITFDNFINYKY